MFVLVTGGSGSGKSEYAEKLFRMEDNFSKRYYIATMKPYGQEEKRRIQRHREQREWCHFHTVEWYQDLHTLELPAECDVLLECMSNLVANEMFGQAEGTEMPCPEEVCRKVLEGIGHLRSQCRNLVVVTNEVFSDGIRYEEDTMKYIHCLGEVNRRLAQNADSVVEVVYSIPVYRTGRVPELTEQPEHRQN